VTAKGGEFRGGEEEGSEEGQEKEVVSVTLTLGAAPPSGTHIIIHSWLAPVKMRFHYFFELYFLEVT
jgi:hypothetical protein